MRPKGSPRCSLEVDTAFVMASGGVIQSQSRANEEVYSPTEVATNESDSACNGNTGSSNKENDTPRVEETDCERPPEHVFIHADNETQNQRM